MEKNDLQKILDSMEIDRLDEVEELLNEIYEETPEELFNHLNGGVIIEEEVHYHPESKHQDLVCLGAYRRDLIGRSIIIYYGSFMELYKFLPRDELKEELRKTLYHELTHHMEYLSNEYDLEIEDKKFLEEYKERK